MRWLALGSALLLLQQAAGRIHHLEIKNDGRFAFSIESFGFEEGGRLDFDLQDISATPSDARHRMGMIIYPTTTESRVAETIDSLILARACALDTAREDVVVVNVSDPSRWCVWGEGMGNGCEGG